MLSFKEIDQKRKDYGISRYKLCKDSTVNSTNYYRLLKDGNPTTKTLTKLGNSLKRLIKTKNGKNNGHKR